MHKKVFLKGFFVVLDFSVPSGPMFPKMSKFYANFPLYSTMEQILDFTGFSKTSAQRVPKNQKLQKFILGIFSYVLEVSALQF